MNLKIGLGFLASIVLVALIVSVIIIAFSSNEKDCQNTIVETRYQCQDGRFVSDMSKCPSVIKPLTTSVRTPSGVTDTRLTTTLCQCPTGSLTTLLTTSTTMWKGPPCTEDADCGSVSYGDITCSMDGDEHIIVNTPKCVNITGIVGKYCITQVSTELRRECPTDWRCVRGVGCVQREEEE